MSNKVFHFSNTGISSGQRFYLKDNVSGLYLRNIKIDSNFPIIGSNLVYNTGNQIINGNKTFNSPIYFISGINTDEYGAGFVNTAGGYIDLRGGGGGKGGSIISRGAEQDVDNAANGGSINLSAGAADGSPGGSINLIGGSEPTGPAGSINLSSGGGNITSIGYLDGGTYWGGGSINLSAGLIGGGGSIDLSNNNSANFSIQTGNLPTQNDGSIYNKVNDNLYIRKNNAWEKVITDKLLSGEGFIIIKDEGSSQGSASTLNFVGAGVSASVGGSTATITINGGGGGGGSFVSPPATPTSAGNQYDLATDSNYLYVCVATNSWKRTAIASW